MVVTRRCFRARGCSRLTKVSKPARLTARVSKPESEVVARRRPVERDHAARDAACQAMLNQQIRQQREAERARIS